MTTPAMIYLALTFTAQGVALAKHGEPRIGRYSFWLALFNNGTAVGLLIWGGFFAKAAA